MAGARHTTPLRVALAATAMLGVLAGPREARADYDFTLALGSSARWLRTTPTLIAPAIGTTARELDAGPVPMGGALTMLGGYVDIGLTIDDRWVVPVLGGGAYGALGSYDAVITSRDGSIVRARPWTAFTAEVLLPGIGYRVKRRRWMFGAALRTGIGWLGMDGVLASGAYADAVELTASTFLLQAELETCRRLDPTTRVCLHIAPRVYDYELLNGATVGVRMEWGR